MKKGCLTRQFKLMHQFKINLFLVRGWRKGLILKMFSKMTLLLINLMRVSKMIDYIDIKVLKTIRLEVDDNNAP